MKLAPFRNEPYTDFSQAENRRAQQAAIEDVRSQLGREYPLLIAGQRITTGDLLRSTNPSNPAELVGAHHKATPELARRAVESAHESFQSWSHVLIEDRVRMLLRAAEILRITR